MTLVAERKGAVRAERLKLSRGLRSPNPGMQRVLAPPGVMASAPTVIWGGANVAQTIANSVYHPYNDAAWRFFAGAVAQAAPSGNDSFFAKTSYVTSVNSTPPYLVDFEWDGTAFEMWTKNNGGQFRILVDGQYTQTALYNLLTLNGGSRDYIKVDFGARAVRRIVLECSNNFYFGGIRIGPTESLWASQYPLGPKVILVGDSFAEGTGASSSLTSFVKELAKLTGWWNLWPSASGSTGYFNPGTGGRVNFLTRLQADVIANAPDLVIWTGGLNDTNYPDQAGYSATNTYAAILACYQAVKAAGVPQIAFSNFYKSGSPTANDISVREQIKAAAAVVGAPFVDALGGPSPYSGTIANYVNTGWMTGTGRTNSLANNGNADVYTTTDSTHPTDAGHAFIARRMASSIAALVSAGAF